MTTPMRRYAVVLAVDALGAGLLRPFLLLYGITVVGLTTGGAGLALTAGLLAGLAVVPAAGRWIDRGARSAVVAATLFVRAGGVALILLSPHPAAFVAGVVLMSAGSQAFPPAHAAVVATLTSGRARDTALAAAHALRNAGLGAGALAATLAVAGGQAGLRVLAVVNAVTLVAAGTVVLTQRLRADPAPLFGPAQSFGPTPPLRHLTPLLVANLPYALCFAVLEVVLPALLVTRLHAAPAWSSGLFVLNTALVIAGQVAVVRWTGRWSRAAVLAAAAVVLAVSYLGFWAAGEWAGPAAIVAVGVVYTLGEMLYTGSSTALVIAAAPAGSLGRALARFRISTGLGMAVAPALLTGLLTVGPAVLWPVLAAVTLGAGAAIGLRLRQRAESARGVVSAGPP